MASCAYHSEARATGKCPQCQQQICDRCRLNGNSIRCGTCQSEHAKGGAEDTRAKRVMCTNHASTPCDTKCTACRKPHCSACLNGAQMCFRCATSANRRGTAPLKPQGTGKLELPKEKKLSPQARNAAIGGAVVVAVGCLLVFGRGSAPPPEPPYMGPTGVAIVGPMAAGPLHGPQVIKLDVRAAQAMQKIEVTIDGKYWERWAAGKHAPFQTDWPTGIFKNGSHEVVAVVTYRGGRRMVADKKRFVVQNRL